MPQTLHAASQRDDDALPGLGCLGEEAGALLERVPALSPLVNAQGAVEMLIGKRENDAFAFVAFDISLIQLLY